MTVVSIGFVNVEDVINEGCTDKISENYNDGNGMRNIYLLNRLSPFYHFDEEIGNEYRAKVNQHIEIVFEGRYHSAFFVLHYLLLLRRGLYPRTCAR